MLYNQIGQTYSKNTTTLLNPLLFFSIPSVANFLLWSLGRTSKKTVSVLRLFSGSKSFNKNIQIRFARYYTKKRDLQDLKHYLTKSIFIF